MQIGMKLMNFVILPHPELFLCSSSSPSPPFTHLVIATLVPRTCREVGAMAGMWNTLSAGLQIVQNKLDHVLDGEETEEKGDEVRWQLCPIHDSFFT